MRSKLSAVDMGVRSGIPVFLANGRDKNVLERIFAGDDIGTFFVPRTAKGRKNWASHFTRQIRNGR